MKYVFFNPNSIISTPDFEFTTSFLKAIGQSQTGWHYPIDLAWIYSQVKNWPTSYHILDAGGGNGPTQFLLTELGFNVTNIDLFPNMTSPPYKATPHTHNMYRISFKTAKSYKETSYVAHLTNCKKTKQGAFKLLKDFIAHSNIYRYISTNKQRHIRQQWRKDHHTMSKPGQLDWIQANLCSVPEITTNSFDAVVSLSALEHIPFQFLPQAWEEINRICKPEAKVAITTSATEHKDTWFHQPSKGHCFSENDLKIIFGALPEKQNSDVSKIIEQYRINTFLKDNLANSYTKSGNNGMPWGKWDPQYFPVGLFC